MAECGNVKGAFSAQDVNIGWYAYETTRHCHLRYGPGDHFDSITTITPGRRVGIQSVRNPKAHDHPPKRPTIADAQGRHWAWAYLPAGREVGWIRAACVHEVLPKVPWAHGPTGHDFQVGMEKCQVDAPTSCAGSAKRKVRVIQAPHVKLRYAPKNTAFFWLGENDTVRELYRRSLEDYTAVVVVSSKTVPEGTRGWVRVSALSAEKATGIDVSNVQGVIDFKQVKGSGERFAICKASEGGDFVDPSFLRNVAGARMAQLEVGGYHFLRPRKGRSGRDEAEFFLHVLKVGGLGKGDIRPTVDVETTTLDVKSTELYVGQFIGTLRMAGFDAILYTYPAFIKWDWTFESDLWIANYQVPRPTIPEPWKDYVLWQYTSDGGVPGVKGKVDRDKCPDLSRIIQR